ncbi:MAG: thioredoxin [Chlorobi bacterium]|nr:MAG: thioredoxin family protein [Bacteroidota bacterium]KXK34721.1 MAG: thioredoxin [Chlorobi bacterium OLB6]MBE2266358.1 thioredoxin family protein [Flavobacteriales bacterium]MBL1162124.1 thioredoxin [Chlorobiota bacterium]MBW7853513.1 thioredoxin family protein [Candidatus Kapabacteria bacterium]MCC6331564.1 thioredoxin family protein [Ignavibacteria bacterium]
MRFGVIPDNADARMTAARPVLLEFSTGWCGSCQTVDAVIRAWAEQEGRYFDVVRIDAEAYPAVTKIHHVYSVPTLILFQSGVECWRHSGVLTVRELREALRPYSTGKQKS